MQLNFRLILNFSLVFALCSERLISSLFYRAKCAARGVVGALGAGLAKLRRAEFAGCG
jgi:hypothetical protein